MPGESVSECPIARYFRDEVLGVIYRCPVNGSFHDPHSAECLCNRDYPSCVRFDTLGDDEMAEFRERANAHNAKFGKASEFLETPAVPYHWEHPTD
jgi:hypothetical protein